MRTFKSVYGLIGAVMPVAYCFYLFYYFLDVAGSVKEAEDMGLGPTVLGLGATVPHDAGSVRLASCG